MSLTQINKAGLDELALDHVFTIGASGTDHYTFQGEGLNGTVNDPTLYLTRGKTYRFENGTGAHPIRIQSTSGASGTAYNTGVTNNAGSGTVIVEVQHDAPDVLYYQCTSHANMNGILYITGALADGGVTSAKLATGAVTTAKIGVGQVTSASIAPDTIVAGDIADDAVTGDKIAANAVSTSHIADNSILSAKIGAGEVGTTQLNTNAVTTAKIADEAVTLAKLPHGDGSSDGKFLRANNGADPTFETVTSTNISGNANNRIITGSDTANTLNADADVTYDSATSDFSILGSKPGTSMDLIVQNNGGGNAAGARVTIQSGSAANTGPQFELICGSHNWSMQVPKAAGNLEFNNNGTLDFLMANDGDFHVVDGDLVFSTAGHGIDFSATSDASGATNELLDDYEEGSFSPSWQMTQNSPSITYYDQQGQYTKIGRTVHFQIYLRVNVVNANGSGILYVSGLPYNAVSNTGQGPAFGCLSFGYMDTVQGMNSERSPHGYVEANDSKIYMYTFPDGSGHAINMTVANNITNNTKMMMSGSYQTS